MRNRDRPLQVANRRDEQHDLMAEITQGEPLPASGWNLTERPVGFINQLLRLWGESSAARSMSVRFPPLAMLTYPAGPGAVGTGACYLGGWPRTRLRPVRLATYIAASARSISVSMVSPGT
jgi:hypothetical protein